MVNSIHAYLDYITGKYSDRTAFQWVNEESGCVDSVTFQEYARDVYRAACYLSKRIPDVKGAHVALIAKNSYHYIVNFFALMMVEAVSVPLNNRNTPENILEEIRYADVTCVVCDHDAREVLRQLPQIHSEQLIDIREYQGEQQTFTRSAPPSADTLAILMFTSGTLGKRKCVMISFRNVFSYLPFCEDFSRNIDSCLDTVKDHSIVILPLYHVAGLTCVIGWPFEGQTVNICKDIRYIMRDLQLMPSDRIVTVPMLLESWVKLIRAGQKDKLHGLSVMVSVGAKIDDELIDFLAQNGVFMAGGYSMTETFAAGMYNNYYQSRRLNSVGIPSSNIQVSVVDEEICIKGDSVMMGYYKDPEATAEAIVDGWLRTGDLGYIDDAGYVFLTGRKKNLIILSSGENVIPEELESLVLQNKNAKEVIVKEKDGKICAEIFCDTEKQSELRQFVTEMNRGLAMYRRITLVDFRDTPFERTASGKIKRG